MKIPFDIKYRPEIESGKYKVETRDGRSLRIVCWDTLGEYPITALIKLDDKESCSTFTNSGAFMVDNEKNPLDLFIITDEEELTEFEKALSDNIDYWIHEELKEPTIESVKEIAQSLLGIAKKELEKDLPKLRKQKPKGTVPYFTAGRWYLSLEDFEKLPKED